MKSGAKESGGRVLISMELSEAERKHFSAHENWG